MKALFLLLAGFMMLEVAESPVRGYFESPVQGTL
jgi:hypothetical protein